jgi:DNA-binding winged helix-turn-helix (wHTH) protein
VINAQPTNVGTAAQNSSHLAARQLLFNIVVLRKCRYRGFFTLVTTRFGCMKVAPRVRKDCVQAPLGDTEPSCPKRGPWKRWHMSARFRIGDLTLDTGRCLLLCDSKPIALGPLTYRLLLALVQAAPDVVTHDELVRSIWGGRSVSPETINQRIKLLRDALADDAGNPRYVEGVRGQGYRLLPRVEVLPDESPARPRPRWIVPTGVAMSLAAVAAIALWIMAPPTDAVRE